MSGCVDGLETVFTANGREQWACLGCPNCEEDES